MEAGASTSISAVVEAGVGIGIGKEIRKEGEAAAGARVVIEIGVPNGMTGENPRYAYTNPVLKYSILIDSAVQGGRSGRVREVSLALLCFIFGPQVMQLSRKDSLVLDYAPILNDGGASSRCNVCLSFNEDAARCQWRCSTFLNQSAVRF